jgi:hypothetical protein
MPPNRDLRSAEQFAATVVSREDGPDKCTIYPADVGETGRTTRWITAESSAFCSLRARR